MDGEGRGGRTAALRCSEATAGGGRGIGRRQRLRASRNDSLHGEDEDDAAQLKVVFDLLLGVSSGGDAAAAGRERGQVGAIPIHQRQGDMAAWLQ